MNGRWLLALAALVVGGAAACDGSGPGADDGAALFSCETETRAIPYAPNLTLPSKSGGWQGVLVESVPAPPAKGTNTWTVQLLDAAGAPQDGIPITVKTFMPAHNHGSSIKATATPKGDGTYLVRPLYLYMAGLWEITLELDAPAGPDSVVFPICIPG